MPAKRRQKSKSKAKLLRKKDFSSEDMDSEPNTSEDKLSVVMSRLSKKHLLNSSSEERSDCSQKENLSKRQMGDPYDADLETSEVDTASQSDMECSASQARGILSPSRFANSRTHEKSEKDFSLNGIRKSHRKKSSSVKLRRSPRYEQCLDLSQGTPIEKMHPSNVKTTPPTDSLISPTSDLQAKFPKLNASDTSTPHSMMSDKKSDFNDTCFGFESLLSPPGLPFSPVPLVPSDGRGRISTASTTSGISSMQSSQLSASTSTSEVRHYAQKKRSIGMNLTGLVDSEDESKKKTKRKRTGPKKKTADTDQWALKVGAEFDDIEMFELSVE